MSALRLPPHSIEAEQSLLGGLLIDNAVWERVGDIVNEADFYRDDHRRIFRQIARLIELGKPSPRSPSCGRSRLARFRLMYGTCRACAIPLVTAS